MNDKIMVGPNQDKVLFAEFIEFCDNKPRDQYIPHSSWKMCAVGQFALVKGLEFQRGVIPSNEIFASRANYPKEIKFIEDITGFKYNKENSEAGNILSCLLEEDGYGVPYNYGDFTDFLKACLPTINEVV